jgi:predicted porin
MIFVGPDKPTFVFSPASGTTGADAKADGWYVEGGWYIPGTRFELDARYDTVTRLEDRTDQHTFDKWTLGVQYHFNPKTRLTVNYEIRDFTCDSGAAACNGPNTNLKGVGDRVGVQLTAIF